MRKGEKRWLKWYMKEYGLKEFNKRGAKEKKEIDRDSERKDMMIIREGPGMYYLLIPYVKKPKDIKATRLVVAKDPGVRTLDTFYDPEGHYGKIGEGLADKLLKLHEKIDELISKRTKCYKKYNGKSAKKNKRKRYVIGRQCTWLRIKIKNIVKDHHWKAAHFYCSRYEYIICPKLDVNSIKKKIKRTMGYKGSKIIRQMMSLSHSKMFERVKYKAQEYKRKFYSGTEEFTSMTCGCCGRMKRDLGKKKIYICQHCGAIMDRDINGARNILIKALAK